MIKTEHILLTGCNGAGKTVQGRYLAASLDRQYADMSRILKLGAAYDSDLRREFACYSGMGDLVPNGIIFQPVERYMQTLRKGDHIVLSGIPRDRDQVDPLLEILATHLGTDSVAVVNMILEPDDAVERCKRRAENDVAEGKEARLEDLYEEKIRKRLKLHDDENTSVLDRLREHGARIVDAECLEKPQDTFLGILHALGIKRKDLFFVPEGFAA